MEAGTRDWHFSDLSADFCEDRGADRALQSRREIRWQIHLAHAQRGNRLLEALDELIRISREAGIPAEVYHIKAAGQQNWSKADNLLSRIEAAQKED